MINNYSFEEDRPEDQWKGRIGAGIFFIFLMIALVMPWFEKEFPIPDSEGLMASFGNVEIAGGGAETPSDVTQEETNPEPQEEETQETEVVPQEVEEVETVEDNSTPPIKTTPDVKPTPTPNKNNNTSSNSKADETPKPNTNALFGGGGGTGTGEGPGKQGTPDGKGDLGGTGLGDKGDGDGAIGNRPNIRKCDNYSGNWSGTEQGKVVVRICVNAAGNVVSAEQIIKKSTILKSSMVDLALGCAKEYKYQAKPGAPNACGEITIQFGLN